jgi:RNA polymerase sigma factor (sigma-70 family)
MRQHNQSLAPIMRIVQRHPILDPAESLELAKQAHRFHSLQSSRNPGESNQDLAARLSIPLSDLNSILTQGRAAHDKLILHNLRLVVSIARKYARKYPRDFQDLISHGIEGLHRAIVGFDPHKGYRVTTYAYLSVKRDVMDAIYRHSLPVRIPPAQWTHMARIKQASAELSRQQGRAVRLQDLEGKVPLSITGKTYLSLETIQNTQKAFSTTYCSLERLAIKQDYGDAWMDPRSGEAEATLVSEERLSIVQDALESLPQDQRDTIKGLFGIGTELKTMKALRLQEQIPESTLINRKRAALKALRFYLEAQGAEAQDLLAG